MATVKKIGKKDLLEKVVKSSGVKKMDVEKTLDSYHSVLVDLVKSGTKFTYPHFGTYQLVTTKARKGRNPATGETIQISAKKKMKFSSSKTLKEKLLK